MALQCELMQWERGAGRWCSVEVALDGLLLDGSLASGGAGGAFCGSRERASLWCDEDLRSAVTKGVAQGWCQGCRPIPRARLKIPVTKKETKMPKRGLPQSIKPKDLEHTN